MPAETNVLLRSILITSFNNSVSSLIITQIQRVTNGLINNDLTVLSLIAIKKLHEALQSLGQTRLRAQRIHKKLKIHKIC